MISKYLILVFTFVVFNLGASAPAQNVVFPTSIQDCIDSGECTTPVLVGVNPPTGPPVMLQYRITFNTPNTVTYLYRYSLGRDSTFEELSERTLDGLVFTQSRFSGYVWLLAQESYSLSAGGALPHRMTLYTEQITGERKFEASSRIGEIQLSLSSAALLAGEGSFSFDSDNPPLGNMNSDGPLVCLAPGCGVGASFNLVNINYVQSGDQAVTELISPFSNIEGQLLYSQERFFPGFDYVPSQLFDEENSLFVGPPVLLGDSNFNGSVDFLDISSFIDALSSGDYLPEADCNEDNAVDFLDVGPFIAILSGN